ncbi:MAG: helix-turn-helix domain-containing protein [Desulfurococcales archaeon]|nr:helix-turn-helix domain-containing protein [Desulfurococcales archaeon]
MTRRRDADVEEYFYRVLATVYRYSREVAVIDFPRSPSKRSIDMVASLREVDTTVLLKCTPDASMVSKREAVELRGIASVLDASAIIVSEMLGGIRLETGVVYDRYGVNLVNLETLEDSISGKSLPYVMAHKDIFKVRVKGEELRKRRIERGFSLGDVASYLGVSRKAVYEYEKGVMEPTIERAEKLVHLFGEDILEPVNLFKPAMEPSERVMEPFDAPEEEVLAGELKKMGFRIVHAKRTSVDLGVRGSSVRVLVVTFRRRESTSSMAERLAKSEKFSEVASSTLLFVASGSVDREKLKSVGSEPLTVREAVEKLRDLESG